MSSETFICVDCSDEHTEYGIDSNGDKVCYDCCAKRDCADMESTGRAVLYLTVAGPSAAAPNCPVVTNWPGSLKFQVRRKRIGNHNFAGCREDVWFNGPDGYVWHGVCYGHNTQLCHCKRTKEKTPRPAPLGFHCV
jgi:hypothetical protein